MSIFSHYHRPASDDTTLGDAFCRIYLRITRVREPDRRLERRARVSVWSSQCTMDGKIEHTRVLVKACHSSNISYADDGKIFSSMASDRALTCRRDMILQHIYRKSPCISLSLAIMLSNHQGGNQTSSVLW